MTAVKAAEYRRRLSNAGPFTVFAPTNAAFDKLPPGTVETLVKPENKDKLRDILEYHVAVGTFKPEMLRDGMSLSMANGGNIKISVKDGKIMINDSATSSPACPPRTASCMSSMASCCTEVNACPRNRHATIHAE